jgi:hypothetical protein
MNLGLAVLVRRRDAKESIRPFQVGTLLHITWISVECHMDIVKSNRYA